MKAGSLLAVALVALIGSYVLANVGYFGGSGHTIELSKSEDIQLVSEEVVIVPFPGLNASADQVAYRCKFVLKNLAATAMTIQVAFPLDGDLHRGPALDDADRVFSYGFIARDEHNTYHVRYARQDAPAKYRELFVWDMAFAPREKRALRVAYILPMCVAMASTAKQEQSSSKMLAPRRYGRPWYALLEPCSFEQLTYITETGNSWKGPIESATFRIDTAGVEYWMGRRGSSFLAEVDPPPGSSELQQLYRMKVGLTYEQRSPGDWKDDPEHGWTSWKIRNYKPGAPIRFCWFVTSLPQDAEDCELLVRQLMGTHPQEAEVLELAEIVAAFFGIAPKTDSVKEFVERQVWYHPRKGLRRSGLTDEQRQTLARLEMIAKAGLGSPQDKNQSFGGIPGTRIDIRELGKIQ
jgi:hypothetical protein